MSKANPNYVIVGASVSARLKADAVGKLAALDLTPSEAIRLFLAHVAENGRLPFEVEPRVGSNNARDRNCVIFQEAAAAV